ncbi:uncharacterized protein EI90DRAFT_3144694 [Cantharellus anzutake]|uniref:uncharacterized protein n=1 Tax=Cantharellus anzutake TaxID=1750568 RepID=UPI00190877FC|nr:uncharacterized protein EI90DRAFT_3144694 [Cantharellus anzutake]KAF8336460.1 hypothetical protein EI90DRAFT_3144694 [Cantharellus anzutake]
MTSGRQYPPLISHLVDVHCHPTDTQIIDEDIDALPLRLCAMASRDSDQQLVADLARKWPHKIIPCFGWHPWVSHTVSLESPPQPKAAHYAALLLPERSSDNALSDEEFKTVLSSLPEPKPLSEVGLDRSFRLPFTPFGDRNNPSYENRRLSSFTVPLEHQLAILEAQIGLAVEFGRNVSMHSVKAQQATVELLKRCSSQHGEAWDRISFDLHSCGLRAETWREIEKAHNNVYISLSAVINTRSQSHENLIQACAPNRILVESDFNDAKHCAEQTWKMLLVIARVKKWKVEESEEEIEASTSNPGAIRRIRDNYGAFVRGNHARVVPKLSGKIRKRNDFPHAEEDWEDDTDEPEVVYGDN